MQLSPVKVTDALCCLLRGRHGDKAIAASTGTLDIGHHLGSHNLRGTIRTKRTWEKTQNITLKATKIAVTLAKDDICGLALPYLLKSVFRSVALVVEDRPLTQRFLLVAAALPAATCRLNPKGKHQRKDRRDLGTRKHHTDLRLSSFDSLSGSFSSELQTEKWEAIKCTAVGTQVTLKKYLRVYMVWYITEWPANHDPQCSDLKGEYVKICSMETPTH